MQIHGFQPGANMEQIQHLLDLKQMQGNLWEARISREGAEETTRQGNVRKLVSV